MNKNTFIHLGFSQIGQKGYDFSRLHRLITWNFPHDYVNLIGYAYVFDSHSRIWTLSYYYKPKLVFRNIQKFRVLDCQAQSCHSLYNTRNCCLIWSAPTSLETQMFPGISSVESCNLFANWAVLVCIWTVIIIMPLGSCLTIFKNYTIMSCCPMTEVPFRTVGNGCAITLKNKLSFILFIIDTNPPIFVTQGLANFVCDFIFIPTLGFEKSSIIVESLPALLVTIFIIISSCFIVEYAKKCPWLAGMNRLNFNFWDALFSKMMPNFWRLATMSICQAQKIPLRILTFGRKCI